MKKQSQFAGGQIGALLVITMVYGDLDDFKAAKNKAKQSQFIRIACCVMRIAKRYLKKQSQSNQVSDGMPAHQPDITKKYKNVKIGGNDHGKDTRKSDSRDFSHDFFTCLCPNKWLLSRSGALCGCDGF